MWPPEGTRGKSGLVIADEESRRCVNSPVALASSDSDSSDMSQAREGREGRQQQLDRVGRDAGAFLMREVTC